MDDGSDLNNVAKLKHNVLVQIGAMSSPKNNRGLFMGANMSRIIAKIIMGSLKDACGIMISEAQYWFRKNRSTTNGMFIVRTIFKKNAGPLNAVYIELTAAYEWMLS